MLEVNIYDMEFIHSIHEDGVYTASYGVIPKCIRYVQRAPDWDGVTIYTDRCLHLAKQTNSRYKVAWLVESPGIHPFSIPLCAQLEDEFDLIITHVPELLSRGPKYKRYTVGSLRVKTPRLPEKTKLCSIIASGKRQLLGHKLRHEVIESCFPNKEDVWGYNYQKFDDKEDPLRDYMFTVSIMNISSENYFTEVLTDALALGVIPIFWGCPNIGDFFNIDGILQFSSIEELQEILKSISPDMYQEKFEYVSSNFHEVLKHRSTDDKIAKIINDHFALNKL